LLSHHWARFDCHRYVYTHAGVYTYLC
jgi:hypothetical protein